MILFCYLRASYQHLMKTLYFVRHAKSGKDNFDITDFDRPLNDRGYQDAHLVGDWLHRKDLRIDVLVTSPAIRAITTALIFCNRLHYPAEQLLLRQSLYDSTMKQYLGCIAEVKKGDSLMLFGHNETISETVQKLYADRIDDMKTCAVVALKFEIQSWSDIQSSKGKLVFHIHPEAIKQV